ncbi:MAG TPA: bifunctional (p)ppGpp synthetase/guanosine-3',5'-bis(diphosphate) 3'-pyrophosphohydrolase, partial [Proteobacteria bacterium]|nr:bifunctional (p)ppGpp synthetase/guanosine-3',5'-bis(diphosphate) 3'-pyrophosphohydrolase [Pseudomonadota bacterium]
MPVRIEDIIDQLTSYHPSADRELILKAYVFAAKAHDGQLRADGEPYMSHPLAVAHILTQLRMDEETIAAGLLHDTVEDNPTITIEEIERRFGKSIAYLVEGVTKITRIEQIKERVSGEVGDEAKEEEEKKEKEEDEEEERG